MIDIESLEIHEVTADDLPGPFEVGIEDLAEILGVSGSTVYGWRQRGIIDESGTSSLGPGRPALLFNLHGVESDLDHYLEHGPHEGRLDIVRRFKEYRQRVGNEITRRSREATAQQVIDSVHAAEEAETRAILDDPETMAAIAEAEQEISEREVLLDRIDHLERLVLRVVKTAEEVSLTEGDVIEVLDIALRHVRGV